ncbi:MAG: hypothetical protein L0387_05130 [Acidobacteria bacterium]|nr:hypothetical protein [Acidobacteriota bacterium]MCI0724099.1 hypothetical protein [Acidobacteriota bacterium]
MTDYFKRWRRLSLNENRRHMNVVLNRDQRKISSFVDSTELGRKTVQSEAGDHFRRFAIGVGCGKGISLRRQFSCDFGHQVFRYMSRRQQIVIRATSRSARPPLPGTAIRPLLGKRWMAENKTGTPH